MLQCFTDVAICKAIDGKLTDEDLTNLDKRADDLVAFLSSVLNLITEYE